jgi:hypothetical protein
MRTLKLIWQLLCHWARHLWPFSAAKPNRDAAPFASDGSEVSEAERLDRLRNPSKYLGK